MSDTAAEKHAAAKAAVEMMMKTPAWIRSSHDFSYLAQSLFNFNVAQGFKDDIAPVHILKLARIGLIHSELSEALEAVRKPGLSAMDQHVPDMTGESIEMADAVIRILDYCAEFNVPLFLALEKKIAYNLTRPFKHGKLV